jgi:maleate cis-trans isomerase
MYRADPQRMSKVPPFRAIGVIAALEEDLAQPVLTGNQIAFWYARQAGVRALVNGYGRVFRTLSAQGR